MSADLAASFVDRPEARATLQHISYSFKRPELFVHACTHMSYAHEHGELSNERLEFLGDAILNAVVSDILYSQFPMAQEGTLSKMKWALLNEEALARMARHIDLGANLRLGKGEQKSDGMNRSSILSNTFEALMAAIYLDGGIAEVQRIIYDLLKLFDPQSLIANDPKSALQEYCLKRFKRLPTYHAEEMSGSKPLRFRVSLMVDGHCIATTEHASKKEAERQLAEEGLALLVAQGETPC